MAPGADMSPSQSGEVSAVLSLLQHRVCLHELQILNSFRQQCLCGPSAGTAGLVQRLLSLCVCVCEWTTVGVNVSHSLYCPGPSHKEPFMCINDPVCFSEVLRCTSAAPRPRPRPSEQLTLSSSLSGVLQKLFVSAHLKGGCK